MIEIDKKFGKYANPEVERKFLVKKLPAEAIFYSQITDYYITNTTLRLREDKRETETRYKLSQKIRPNPDSTRLILHTNIYLTESEFNLLVNSLPSKILNKTRFKLEDGQISIWIDQFKGVLESLVIAEIDFGNSEDFNNFSMPTFATKEVTDDERFTGASLTSTTIEELQKMLLS